MTEIEKNKNIISIFTDRGIYKYDINTGISYGIRGKTIKAIPKSVVDDALFYSYNPFLIIFCEKYLERESFNYELIKKLDSLNNIILNSSEPDKANTFVFAGFTGLSTSKQNIIFKNIELFKQVGFDIGDFFYCYLMKILNNLYPKEFELISKRYSEKDVDSIVEFLLIYFEDFNSDFFEFYIYYLSKGYVKYSTSIFFPSKLNQFYDQVKSYIIMCKAIGIKPQKTPNFIQEYVKVAEVYEANKRAFENKQLQEWQTKIKIQFENDKFITVIPVTKKEFEEEAEAQHNCVYSIYFNMVLDRRTRVVFIRRKGDINKSLVTCEVALDGSIRQFLQACNAKVKDPDLLDFKLSYQDYLNRVFNRRSL
jgi:hypothetical protein